MMIRPGTGNCPGVFSFYVQGRTWKSAVTRHAPCTADRGKCIFLCPIKKNSPSRNFFKKKGAKKMSSKYRDVTLNKVTESDIDREIRVAGWVENIRDHGGVSFIDLRDMYAVLQVVIRDGESAKSRPSPSKDWWKKGTRTHITPKFPRELLS